MTVSTEPTNFFHVDLALSQISLHHEAFVTVSELHRDEYTKNEDFEMRREA